MEAKVLKTFRDKNTKKLNAEGSTITITDARFKEINAHKKGPFLEDTTAAEKAAKADKKAPAKKED